MASGSSSHSKVAGAERGERPSTERQPAVLAVPSLEWWPPCILVADGDAAAWDSLRPALSSAGELVVVTDGPTALTQALAKAPDFVLADATLAREDGFDLLAALRSEPRTSMIPVLLLAHDAEDSALLAGLEAGADDYLIRPFTARQLLARIAAQQTLSRRRREAAKLFRESRENEDRFRTLTTYAPVGIFMSSSQGDTVFVNESWCRLTGLTPDQARGQGWSSALHPEDKERVLRGWNKAVASGTTSEAEFRFLRPDGSVVWVQGRAVPLPGAGGSLRGYIGTLAEITERIRMEEELKNARQQLQLITDNMAMAVVHCSADHRYVWCNPAYAALVGKPAEEIAGHHIREVIGQETYAQICPQIERVLSGERVEFETRANYPHAEPRWIKAAYVPTYGKADTADGWVAVINDVTEEKRQEDALREADRRKDEFLAVLAHELRNPLAPICTGLELMRLAGNEAALMDEVRSTMERQARQLVRLVDDLLDVSRITRGRVELRKCRVELTTVLDSAVEAARPVIEQWGHHLSVSLPPQPIVLEADATRLAQVLSNLLNNAAKYMKPGGQITLTARHDRGEGVIAVKDTGIGIPPEMLDRVFDMFTQVDRSLERSHSGLGIGLTLVKRLVELHGGSVAARSAGRNQGSEFVVRLPLAAGESEEPSFSAGDPPVSVPKHRVLVVDDNESAAVMLGLLLQAFGNEVRTAGDGVTALEIAAQFRPDLILLDLGMPRLNGLDAARRIRQEPWGREMVLVALTGWGQEEDKRRTQEAGFDYHFVKPIAPAALQKLLVEHQPARR